MHKKYAAQGVATVSVALVNPQVTQEKDKEDILKFLKTQKATFPNLYLDEKEEVWMEKFKTLGPPVVYVFNREGKHKKFEGGDVDDDYANIEKQVVEWLKAK